MLEVKAPQDSNGELLEPYKSWNELLNRDIQKGVEYLDSIGVKFDPKTPATPTTPTDAADSP